MAKKYLEVAVDSAVAVAAYYIAGWIGLAIWALVVLSYFLVRVLESQETIKRTLLSRLPDRCAFCHREIVDEGGVFDEVGIYHAECSDKLYALEGLRREVGVPRNEAIHMPRARKS